MCVSRCRINPTGQFGTPALKYADMVLKEYGATLLSSQEPSGDGQLGQRCDTLEFYVPPDANLSIVTVSIGALASFPRQEDYCTIYMPKIQQAFNERGLGLRWLVTM